MGGNAFQDLQKLTPAQYQKITKELYELISPMCLQMEPYIPLPEKQVHGDIDFLILFKEGFQLQNILEVMELTKEEYIINNNLTANVAYRKKQIDFNITLSPQQFERCRFYKSYGGIGAFLGLLLPSKLVKFNEEGLYCLGYHEHLKLEFNVCNSIPEIIKFYGLSTEKYSIGFKTRREVFDYLINSRFIDPVAFKTKKPKWTTKLINSFIEFLQKNEEIKNPFFEDVDDPVAMTLKHFGKEKQFEEAFNKTIADEKEKKGRSQKWNGKHIIDHFGVPTKNLNSLKKKFQTSFENKQNYQQFVDTHDFQQIILAFAKVCELQPIKKNELQPIKKKGE